MISAKTNINSINAQISYQVNSRDMEKSLERLATGYRINKSGDDAAGLALSTGFVSQIYGNQQAINNLNDATALIQTADSTIRNVAEIMQRMRELAVQASNDTYSNDDRTLMNIEYKQMEEEVTRIVSDTKWNKSNLLDGSNASNANGTYLIQAGADNSQSITIDIGDFSIASGHLSKLNGLDITTQANANNTINDIDDAFQTLLAKQADFGSYQNRLMHAIDTIVEYKYNMVDSNGRVLVDTDYGKELTKMTKHQIVSQGAIAMASQSNAVASTVSSLLESFA